MKQFTEDRSSKESKIHTQNYQQTKKPRTKPKIPNWKSDPKYTKQKNPFEIQVSIVQIPKKKNAN